MQTNIFDRRTPDEDGHDYDRINLDWYKRGNRTNPNNLYNNILAAVIIVPNIL